MIIRLTPHWTCIPKVAAFAALAIAMTSCRQAAIPGDGNAIDTVNFGDRNSDEPHGIRADHAENIVGAMDQPAVRLLPLDPPSHNGGSISFTMKVDPEKQNYVTVKLWGSDTSEEQSQLLVYANGRQLGYRRQSDYDLLNMGDPEPLAPERFVYETRPLPLWMTKGKNSIDLKISVLGRIWPYGETFEKYQRNVTQPSRGIYRAYTHANPRFEPPSSEDSGSMPLAKPRPVEGESVIEESKNIVNRRLAALLDNPSKEAGLFLLAEAYHTSWTPAYQSPKVIGKILSEGDAMAERFLSDPKYDGGWLGAGPLGEAIVKTWPEIGEHLDVPFPPDPSVGTRREAWSRALRQSIDFWRTHRRYYTNQAMFVDGNIYRANRGLALVDPPRALPEEKALRYVRESVGLEPWMDKDVIDENGGDEPSDPFGGTYNLVTRKNLSRELGWVGSYGEVILPVAVELARFTNDEQIRQQVGKLQAARLFFRYPGFDADGYSAMKISAEVCNRNSRFPFPGAAYSSAGVREFWGMEMASLLPEDPVVVGAAQRFLNDGHYYPHIASRLKSPDTLGLMRNVEDYEKVKKLPVQDYRFPTEVGQPDFVFADEENAVVVIKRRDTLLFVNFFFRAETAVNSVVKIMEITPEATRLVTAKANTVVNESGVTVTRPDLIDYMRGDKLRPPGEQITQAWAGEVMPVSVRPEGAREPVYGKFGPTGGLAAFYWLSYGDYLIGLNTTDNQTFDLPVADGTAYTDLVSSREIVAQDGRVPVPPLSTVVLCRAK